jgi:DNA-directed RNA polymerase subunit RPC12/RpoP
MTSEKRLGCYRCGGPLELILSPAGAPEEIRTFIIQLACQRCGQQYELQYSLVAIFATSSEGEAQAFLHLCAQCGQLYQAQQDEPHVCRTAGNEVEREDT